MTPTAPGAGKGRGMKRGTPEHPKVVRFAKLLRVRRHVAVGLLEMLWHLTARYTPAGDVGKWSDDEIATALDWDGDPGRLLQAFVAAGLLEPHPAHRLIVHDWAEHADDGVRVLLKRRGLPFVSRHVATCSDIIPLPKPLPEPKPLLSLTSFAQGDRSPHSHFAEFWATYPRKRHKPDAERAWKRVRGDDALAAVVAGVGRWKASDAWRRGFVEDPATFLRQRQWEDDPAPPRTVPAMGRGTPDPATTRRMLTEKGL
jgi:hypothetical protein